MRSNFGTNYSVTEAMAQAEASDQPHNVVVVHNLPGMDQVCDIHYGAYTVEESTDSQGPYSTMSVKRRDEKTGDKSIVAVYHRKDVHAVYFVDGEQHEEVDLMAFEQAAALLVQEAASLGSNAAISEVAQRAKRNVRRAVVVASMS